ncbi:sensor histidine kinase [Phyllobacterium myrsinacearum]|uniref:histidine kinase n=1 Tax=Phyllobacterium myrsinacearum TaxID=28101 RepID=A0A839EUK6_9HYPH|nr:ATP-binding protein [Phyllobacterium myrsinacearum]MBA8880097.1 signal transduction histidine kinase [Phyllobacterium myrsinacearum]
MSRFAPLAALVIAVVIFALDTLTTFDMAIAVLYVTVVLLSLSFAAKKGLLFIGVACMALTLLSFAVSHGENPTSDSFARCFVSLAAIGITTLLAYRVKTAIAVLGESEQRYRTIFLATGVAILEMDFTAVKAAIDRLKTNGFPDIRAAAKANPDFAREAIGMMKLTNVNNTTLTTFGAKDLDTFRTALPVLIGKEMEGSIWALLEAIWDVRTSYESETIMNDVDGNRIAILYNVAMPHDRPTLDMVLVSIMDVTARHEAENELHETHAELAHVTRVATLGELTVSIAHEVNQPLAAIVTNGGAGLRWLKRSEPDLDEVETSMQRMIADAGRASEVIKRLRALSSKTAPQSVPININDVIAETMMLVQREVMNQRVDLKLELAADLPPVSGDHIQLQQVIINLILNAVQAMSDPSVKTRQLLIQTAVGEGVIVAKIRDTGPGFAAEKSANLFDAFYTTKSNGMGMGLSICRSIIAAHGGRITANAEPGKGASFEFTIPFHEETAS